LKLAGFTLIEVLVALAIISIGLLAIIKTASQNIQNTAYLQDKMTAMWVGEQVINEARVGLYQSAFAIEQTVKRATIMLGKEWAWNLKQDTTPNPRINKISIQVFSKGQEENRPPLIYLETYVYLPGV